GCGAGCGGIRGYCIGGRLTGDGLGIDIGGNVGNMAGPLIGGNGDGICSSSFLFSMGLIIDYQFLQDQ
ncbi:MAG TPA: hypothetical protein DCL66_12885, partial [Gammaproteobacteria bacterium]|nr:hypothetical protein [Gammaproteobacteria bacterium]